MLACYEYARRFRLTLSGTDGVVTNVALPEQTSELDAVLEALAVQGVRSVELRQGLRRVMRIEWPAEIE